MPENSPKRCDVSGYFLHEFDDKTPARRQAARRYRRKQQGFVQVTVWIHETQRDELKRFVKELRKAQP